MKYNLQQLISGFDKGERMKFLFFWGHTVKSELTKACFSQWYPSEFVSEGVRFKTAEHWMMAQKAKLFHDEAIFQKIIDANSPAEAKKLGRAVNNFDNVTWDTHKYKIVVEGNLLKFSQDQALKTFLLNTKNRVLVEASPYDKIWGIGMHASNEHVENPKLWRGENLLGFALMEVRDLLG